MDSKHQFLIVMCIFECGLGSNMLLSAPKTDLKKRIIVVSTEENKESEEDS